MLILSSREAMTLTELLVAAIIISIMMIGMVSVDFAVHKARSTAGDDTLLQMRTAGTLTRINRDVALAVGDNSSPGVNTANGALCVRQDSGNPNVYTDDSWACYTLVGNVIYRCIKTFAVGPQACTNADVNVGSAVSFTYSFVFDRNSTPKNLYVDMAIVNRANPAAAKHPTDNPEYSLSTRIVPAGHGF